MTMSDSKQSTERNLWTIVLAAGEGTRLRALTRALHGEDLPKQFATIQGQTSMLQATLLRTANFSSAARTVVVVPNDREALAREQIGESNVVDVVAQPKNVGTGPGLLLPLSRVVARDPDAIVVVMPSDHYVRDQEAFVESVRSAALIARDQNALVLIAAAPEGPETQYGWIVTGPHDATRGREVTGFVEKPDSSVANELFRAGALWSTFIMVGPASRFLALAKEHLPDQSSLFETYRAALGTARERRTLWSLYGTMDPADFSRDVLEKSKALRVVPLRPCGWSDWGTPDRVLASLRGTDDFEVLCKRLQASLSTSGAHEAPSSVSTSFESSPYLGRAASRRSSGVSAFGNDLPA
jgi:mannose-1-phosphate guanylyltransferase